MTFESGDINDPPPPVPSRVVNNNFPKTLRSQRVLWSFVKKHLLVWKTFNSSVSGVGFSYFVEITEVDFEGNLLGWPLKVDLDSVINWSRLTGVPRRRTQTDPPSAGDVDTDPGWSLHWPDERVRITTPVKSTGCRRCDYKVCTGVAVRRTSMWRTREDSRESL